MKSFASKLIPAMSLMALGVVPAAYGSDLSRVTVEIPFAFTAASKTLPAGHYALTGGGAGVFRIAGPESMMVIANSAHENKPADATKVVFHRYGDQYFLQSVWVAGSLDGTEIVRSHRERELARGNARPSVLMLVGNAR